MFWTPEEEFKQAVHLASVGRINEANFLYNLFLYEYKGLRNTQENFELFFNNCLGNCYYHVITNLELSGCRGISALSWLLEKTYQPNEVVCTNYIYRPVHTAIQVGNNTALLVLLSTGRFDLCLRGNYHQPYGYLTPLQLALLYDNEQVAKRLLSMENGLEILCAESSNELDAIQFSEKIGKLEVLRNLIQELHSPSRSQSNLDMDPVNNLMSGLNLSDDTEHTHSNPISPSFRFS